MKKLLFIFGIILMLQSASAGTYVVMNASNTGTVVATGKISIDRANIVNSSSDTLWIHFYDKATVATYTNTPFLTIESPPNSNKCALPNYAPTPDAIAGLCIRAVKRNGSTNPLTSILSSTVSATFTTGTVTATYYPLIQIKVH